MIRVLTTVLAFIVATCASLAAYGAVIGNPSVTAAGVFLVVLAGFFMWLEVNVNTP